MDCISDDICFPKATVEPRLIKLQTEVTEFVTSVILNHERIFYHTICNNFADMKTEILGTTCPTIIQMVTTSTNKIYNEYYLQIQNHVQNDITNLICEISSYGNYGCHILLDKLVRLTIDIHHEIIREKLSLDNIDLYLKTVLDQINVYLLSTNLLHILSKGPNDDTEFYVVPDGEVPFNISSKIVYEKK
jgi:hypothetical protein